MTKPIETIDGPQALMKYRHQWEHLASEGHVLLARVDAYRHKVRRLWWLALGALLATLAAVFVPPFAGRLIGWPVGVVAGWIKAAPTAQAQPAPRLASIYPELPAGVRDPAVIPSAQAIETATGALVELVKAGKPVTGCDTTTQITSAWATAESFVPKCRISSDRTRVWVWGGMAVAGGYVPFFLVVRRDASGAVTPLNVAVRARAVGRYPQIRPAQVPRALAADFPELLISGANK